MGVDIGGILERKSIEFEDLRNKRIAIDAFNTLYQFLSIIRQRDGTPLVDTKGRTTSHLAGIFYRNARLLECGVKPIYVFDGKSPEFKEKTKEKRSEAKQEARKKLETARERGIKDLKIFAQATATLDEEKIESSKKLLSYMGIPVIQAPSEGEAQAAYMAKEGFAYATGSQDYDALIFGSPILVRNLTISGKRKLPRRGVYISITPELIDLKKTLENLGLDRKKLIWIALLCGTDFNEGVKGVGPKTGLKIVKDAENLEEVYKKAGEKVGEVAVQQYNENTKTLEEIEKFFLEPPAKEISDKDVEAGEIQKDKIIEFLCGEHDFSLDRIEKGIDRILKKDGGSGSGQSKLGGWF